jgi:hypothetical protein
MTQPDLDPSLLWDALLSRQPGRIVSAYRSLAAAEQAPVFDHLKRMVSEPGWLLVQRDSARLALDVLENLSEGQRDSPA